MRKWIIVIVFAGLSISSIVYAGDSLSRKQLEARLEELQNLLPQIEQAFTITQGRIAEIKNLLEEMDKQQEGKKDVNMEKKDK